MLDTDTKRRIAKFPATRYQGSKLKHLDRLAAIWSGKQLARAADIFGGTGSVAYRMKQAGMAVTYNDLLRFNQLIGSALIANNDIRLSESEVEWLIHRHDDVSYSNFVERTFHDVYFTDDENRWIDQTICNMRVHLAGASFALAFFALAQACIVKRPYNLFHRKNLYVRFAEVERSFGNKVAWDRPFESWFRQFVGEANAAVFDNGKTHSARRGDATAMAANNDLIYADPPYVSSVGTGVDYLDFYHFLEGLADYDAWPDRINWQSKHLRMTLPPNPWTSSKTNTAAFEQLFRAYRGIPFILSYRSDGLPSMAALVEIAKPYWDETKIVSLGAKQYALSTNESAKEIVLLAGASGVWSQS